IPAYSRRTFIATIFLASIASGALTAQNVDTVGPVQITDPAVVSEARQVVADFFEYGSDPGGVDSVDVPRYGVDWFADFLVGLRGKPFWEVAHRYDVGDVYSIRPEGTILMVTSRTWVDSV